MDDGRGGEVIGVAGILPVDTSGAQGRSRRPDGAQAVHDGQPRRSSAFRRLGRQCRDWERGPGHHGGSMFDRVDRRPGRDCPGLSSSRSDDPSRRRLQTAKLAVLVPGPGRRGPTGPRCRTGRDRSAGGDRSDGARAGGPGGRLRRHAPDRLAQHGQLSRSSSGSEKRPPPSSSSADSPPPRKSS